jgi:hypothetical protein
LPNLKALSADRWKLFRIGHNSKTLIPMAKKQFDDFWDEREDQVQDYINYLKEKSQSDSSPFFTFYLKKKNKGLGTFTKKKD